MRRKPSRQINRESQLVLPLQRNLATELVEVKAAPVVVALSARLSGARRMQENYACRIRMTVPSRERIVRPDFGAGVVVPGAVWSHDARVG